MKERDSIYGYEGTRWGLGDAAGCWRPRLDDLSELLAPLVDQMRTYDGLRVTLEREGGQTADLARLTELLSAPFDLTWSGEPHHQCRLSSPELVHKALRELWGHDVSLQVRQLDTGMPVYFLCRTKRDWFGDCDMVIEDLYRSPGYPVADPRLVRLMRHGREEPYIMLAPFREGAAALVEDPDDPVGLARRIDAALTGLGRHVFSAAWHEDQRLGLLAAAHLGMPHFAHAIELVYLVLSGELCELRSVVDDADVAFFERVYPQPAISAFLAGLGKLDGGVLAELPRVALDLYARLAKAFARLLAVEIPWASEGARLPLHKVLFANCTRLPIVGRMLESSTEVVTAAAELDHEAELVIESILSFQVAAS